MVKTLYVIHFVSVCLFIVFVVQLASIPGLEDVTVSTPAPTQPTEGSASGGTAPPPASDVPQSAAAEVHDRPLL